MVQVLRDMLAELVSPTRCASCERPGELICASCRAALERIDPVHACVRCGAPFGDLLCTECTGGACESEGQSAGDGERAVLRAGRAAGYEDAGLAERAFESMGGFVGPAARAKGSASDAPALDRCLAVAVFDGPPARIVRAYKDGGERRLAAEIAELMLEAARAAERDAPTRYGGLITQADAVTFVPVTASAYRRRGFDHMELIARAFSERAGVPYLDALAKYGHADQRELSRRERLTKAQDAYTVVTPAQVMGARLLLLDDVITTGATLNAAVRALRRAGAARVDALAFARVMDA